MLKRIIFSFVALCGIGMVYAGQDLWGGGIFDAFQGLVSKELLTFGKSDRDVTSLEDLRNRALALKNALDSFMSKDLAHVHVSNSWPQASVLAAVSAAPEAPSAPSTQTPAVSGAPSAPSTQTPAVSGAPSASSAQTPAVPGAPSASSTQAPEASTTLLPSAPAVLQPPAV